jgi:hypothetical protein
LRVQFSGIPGAVKPRFLGISGHILLNLGDIFARGSGQFMPHFQGKKQSDQRERH